MKPYYDVDGITIYHGDAADVIPQLSDVHAVITSPPYNQMGAVNSETMSGLWAQTGGGRGMVERWDNGYPDMRDEIEYQADQIRVFGALAAVTTPTASLFYNHQCRWRNGTLLHPVQWFQPDGWCLRQEIIWARRGGMMMNARMFVRTDERILWFVKPDGWVWNQDQVGHGTVWTMPAVQGTKKHDHPATYPIGLPQRAIAATTQPGDLVLDPYMGSGTTLVAAQQLGRKAVGIEIVEEYCDIAVKRLGQLVLDVND